MLMKVGTETSDLIHDYILDFEEGCVKYAVYQKEQEIEDLKTLTSLPILDASRQNALLPAKIERKVYVFTSKRYEKMGLYKIGASFNIKKRKGGINTTHVLDDDEFYEVYSANCYEAATTESFIHEKLDAYRYRPKREFFLAPIIVLKRLIDIVVNKFNEMFDDVVCAMDEWTTPKEVIVLSTPNSNSNTKVFEKEIDKIHMNYICDECKSIYNFHDNKNQLDNETRRIRSTASLHWIGVVIDLVSSNSYQQMLKRQFDHLVEFHTHFYNGIDAMSNATISDRRGMYLIHCLNLQDVALDFICKCYV